jgi:ketosteroid isomerase-like protein
MKKSWFAYLLIFYLLVSVPTHAQTLEQRERELKLRQEAAEAEIQSEELVNLQRETVRALQLHNGSFFNRVYSDDFIWTSPTGSNMDKTAFVNTVQNTDVKYSSFVVSDIRVRVFQQTAVVSCLWSSRGTARGSDFSHQSRVTNVYVYGQRGWQLVASQETRLPG